MCKISFLLPNLVAFSFYAVNIHWKRWLMRCDTKLAIWWDLYNKHISIYCIKHMSTIFARCRLTNDSRKTKGISPFVRKMILNLVSKIKLLQMFVAEKVLLRLVISLTDELTHEYAHDRALLCFVVVAYNINSEWTYVIQFTIFTVLFVREQFYDDHSNREVIYMDKLSWYSYDLKPSKVLHMYMIIKMQCVPYDWINAHFLIMVLQKKVSTIKIAVIGDPDFALLNAILTLGLRKKNFTHSSFCEASFWESIDIALHNLTTESTSLNATLSNNVNFMLFWLTISINDLSNSPNIYGETLTASAHYGASGNFWLMPMNPSYLLHPIHIKHTDAI